jgi:hypothetical protein
VTGKPSFHDWPSRRESWLWQADSGEVAGEGLGTGFATILTTTARVAPNFRNKARGFSLAEKDWR